MATTETKADDLTVGAPPITWRTKIGPDPYRPGPDRWRLLAESVPVWAIIGYLPAIGDVDDATQASLRAIAETASDYEISEEAVRAALAHYVDHKRAIDTLIASNEAATITS